MWTVFSRFKGVNSRLAAFESQTHAVNFLGGYRNSLGLDSTITSVLVTSPSNAKFLYTYEWAVIKQAISANKYNIDIDDGLDDISIKVYTDVEYNALVGEAVQFYIEFVEPAYAPIDPALQASLVESYNNVWAALKANKQLGYVEMKEQCMHMIWGIEMAVEDLLIDLDGFKAHARALRRSNV